MPWRVLASGQMLEVSGGMQVLPGREPREVTTIVMSRNGEVHEEISAAHIEAYKQGEERIRALVEYGVWTTDDDGNKVFEPRGIDGSKPTSVISDDDKVNAHISELEAKVAELEGKLADETKRADETEQLVNESLSYSDLSAAAVKAEAEAKKLSVTRADGGDGEPLKTDYVAALEAARAA